MGKLKIALLVLFLVGLVGAVRSINSLPQQTQNQDLLNKALNFIGLGYFSKPPQSRTLDYVPTKVTSETSRINKENPPQSSTPAASLTEESQSPESISNTYQPPNYKPVAYPSPTSGLPGIEYFQKPPTPPVAPNSQTLGAKTQKENLKPPIPPINPNQTSTSSPPKTSETLNTILGYFLVK